MTANGFKELVRSSIHVGLTTNLENMKLILVNTTVAHRRFSPLEQLHYLLEQISLGK
jgi:hypothetical protein